MKSISLAALAAVYLAAWPGPLSLLAGGAGFLLNMVAATALGADRTYYGHEIAGLPAVRVTAFPYSVLTHPMLVGNIVAYAGTLLDAGFRAAWWPLATVHVLLNLGLLAMETGPAPRSTRRPAGAERVPEQSSWVGPGLMAMGLLAAPFAGRPVLAAVALALCIVGYGGIHYRHDTRPRQPIPDRMIAPREKALE